jgi:cytochrome P450
MADDDSVDGASAGLTAAGFGAGSSLSLALTTSYNGSRTTGAGTGGAFPAARPRPRPPPGVFAAFALSVGRAAASTLAGNRRFLAPIGAVTCTRGASRDGESLSASRSGGGGALSVPSDASTRPRESRPRDMAPSHARCASHARRTARADADGDARDEQKGEDASSPPATHRSRCRVRRHAARMCDPVRCTLTPRVRILTRVVDAPTSFSPASPSPTRTIVMLTARAASIAPARRGAGAQRCDARCHKARGVARGVASAALTPRARVTSAAARDASVTRDARVRAIKSPDTEDAIPDENFKPEELKFQDIVSLWVTQILQTYGDKESKDNAPVCEGVIDDLVGGPIFLALYPYFRRYGGVFKLAFGPKVFMVLSDPVIVREVLKEKPFSFDKGVLAEILEPIMGQGLIPAPYAVWKNRRRQLVPGFHKAWLDHMVGLFGHCSNELLRNLDKVAASGEVVDMEERFCSVSLDIIGLAVFNYDFGSVTKESPIISAVYNCLQEAAHRSTFYVPYWNLPFATMIVPRQREFKKNMGIINDTLNDLIKKAQQFEGTDDLEELQNRDYSKVKDPSLLRFLVDIRGADVTDTQLRDDLMTMLIAGHETTAAVLTWGLYCLVQQPELLKRVQADIDEVFGDDDRTPTYEDIQKLESVRLCIAEALRLYPEPPILIRRCLEDVKLPKGAGDVEVTLIKGMDIFISVWNLHRSPECWENPDTFDPFRFKRPYTNPGVKDWAGYNPDLMTGLYPNEVASDFAFIPFGAGARKCIGDQFAMLEATIAMAMVLRRYDFELMKDPKDIGMEMGATIHTAGGLPMKLTRRRP